MPIEAINENLDIKEEDEEAIREFMLMQHIKMFSPKNSKLQGKLEMLRSDLNACQKAVRCLVTKWSSVWVTRYCQMENKLFKMFLDPERLVLEGVLDFDLHNCDL